MGEFSLMHWLVVGVVVLIFFRKDQLPGLGKSIGQSIRGFKEALNEIEVPAKDIKDLSHQPQQQQPMQQSSQQSTQQSTQQKSSQSGSKSQTVSEEQKVKKETQS